MSPRLPLITAAALATLALLLPAAPARGDGGPLVGTDAGWRGVTNPRSDSRYVAVVSSRTSLVARISKRGGRLEAFARLHRPFTFPSVALDQSAAGLAADGRTLALARPSYGSAKRSAFAVLDARSLRLRKIVRLPGYLTLDGISADGRTLYLVKYRGRFFSNAYQLRAFDLRTGRLDPDPIVDPRNPGEKMTGMPLTRIVSRDGRWDYTLYRGEENFIHALDTRRGEAFCVDLPNLRAGTPISRVRLGFSADGSTLDVSGPHGPLAEVDTGTLAVSEPGGSSSLTSTIEVVLIAVAACFALVLSISIPRARRRRRQLAPG